MTVTQSRPFYALPTTFCQILLTYTMSAAQKIQQHPVVVQVQQRATHYVAQLDKEVRYLQIPDAKPPTNSIRSSQSTLFSTTLKPVPKFPRHTPFLVDSFLWPFSIRSTPSPHPFRTSLVGPFPRIYRSRPSNPLLPMTMFSGSHIGLSLASSTSSKALHSVLSSTTFPGISSSRQSSLSGSSSPLSVYVFLFYTVRRQISVHPSSKRPTSRIVCIVQTRLASEQLDVHACSTEHGDYTEACEDAGGTGDCGLANGDCGFWETVG